MNTLKVIAAFSVMFGTGVVHAEASTLYEGAIRNMTHEDIYLANQSWDTEGRAPMDLKIPPGEVGGFNIQVPSESGEVNIIMASEGGRKCNFVLTYGIGKRVQGPMTLIGPSHWKVTKSFGSVPAVCEMKVDEWAYKESFDVRYRMK